MGRVVGNVTGGGYGPEALPVPYTPFLSLVGVAPLLLIQSSDL